MSATYNPGGTKPPLVNQPTAAPTRKVRFGATTGTLSGALALMFLEPLQQIQALSFLSDTWWSAASMLVVAGIGYVGGSYFAKERAR